MDETGRSRTRQGDREAIIAEATRLFASRGLFGASLRDIAAESGLPLSTLSRHFPRKRDLQAAVLSTAIEATASRIFAALQAQDPPRERMRRYVDATVRDLLSRQSEVRILEDAFRNVDRPEVADLTFELVTRQQHVRTALADTLQAVGADIGYLGLDRAVDVTFAVIYGLVWLNPVNRKFREQTPHDIDLLVEEAAVLVGRVLGVDLS